MGDTLKRIGAGVATGGLSEVGRAAGDAAKDAPAPPDFASLANEQTKQNRPNQSTPYGSTSWTTGPDGRPTQTTSFAPGTQALSDQLQGQAGDFASMFSKGWQTPLDNGAQARDKAESAIYGRAESRLKPMWDQRESDTRASLANQGLDPTGEAGGKELDTLNRGRNDAYTSALQEAIMGGGQEATRQQNLDLTSRMAPLAGQTAALSGLSGLRQLLQMPGYGQAGDVLGAGKMGYDANMEQFQANGGPLGGWGQLLQSLGPLVKSFAKSGAGG